MITSTLFNQKKAILFSIGIALLYFLFSYDYGMFWDNVLFGSKMGNHLYYNGLFDWTIPDEFDPGHPPFLGFILAIFWKIFGHSLWVSHLAMLPFAIGVIYQLQKFVFYFTKNTKLAILGLLLLLADPTLATSFVLVNPETIVIFFFFMSINGILYQEKKWKFIGLFFLSIITFRSMMLFAGVFVFDICNVYFLSKKSFQKIIRPRFIAFYFLSSLPGIVFVIWRLITKGWLQTHPDSPWADLWHLPSFSQFLKNIAVLGHRYLDFGRVFIFIFIIIGFFYLKKRISKEAKQLLLLGICSVLFVVLAVLFSTNEFGHRYFIVSYISFIMLAFLFMIQLNKHFKALYLLLLIGLFSGNLWIYPERISQGWDATLAHTPYHSLREQAIQSLEPLKVDVTEVASFFPNYNKLDEINLNRNQKSFTRFSEKSNYVFYSNVYNLTDNEYDMLEKNYEEIQRFERFNIYVSIYKIKGLED